MQKFDCRKVKDKCKADCCGCMTPVSKDVYEKNKHLIKEKIEKELTFDVNENEIMLLTKSGKCCFLNTDNDCMIYEERPDVCRRYGTDFYLPCPYIDRKGNLRNEAKHRRFQGIINHNVDDSIKQMEKRIGNET